MDANWDYSYDDEGNLTGKVSVAMPTVTCHGPNCDQSSCRIKTVLIPASKYPDSRIVAQTGEGVYDAAGQVVKSKHGDAIPETEWKV